MIAARLLAVVLVAVAAGACGQSAPPAAPTSSAPVLPVASSPREDGDRLARAGDWAGAVVKYREALRASPDDVALRFALGSALSHLDRRDEAAEQFDWVVRHGRPGQAEVSMARQWLSDAAAPDTSAPAPVAERPTAPDPTTLGKIQGKTVWPSISRDTFRLPLQILLVGDDDATRGRILQGRTYLGEPYSIASVPEGQYRLTAQVAGVRLWDTRVAVSAGRDTVLDLTPDRSLVSPDQFPQRDRR